MPEFWENPVFPGHHFFRVHCKKPVIPAHGDTISSPLNIPYPEKRAFLSTVEET